MHYRVINKDGNVAHIQYACFGMLSMVDGWYSEFQHHIRTYLPTGEEYKWKEGAPEEVDGCKYVPGFYPSNFLILQYVPPAERTDIFIDYPELLEHPLFKNVVMTQDDEGVYFNVHLENLRMDETLYPLLFIRNVLEMEGCKATFDNAIELGAKPATALLFASIFHTVKTVYGKEFYGLDMTDSSVINSENAPVGDLAELVKGELSPVYLDRKWSETGQGYSSYGVLAAPYKEWEPWEMDFGIDEEEDEEYLPELTEPHPHLGVPSSLSTPFCVRPKDDYPKDYQQTLDEATPVDLEEFMDLIIKVESYE